MLFVTIITIKFKLISSSQPVQLSLLPDPRVAPAACKVEIAAEAYVASPPAVLDKHCHHPMPEPVFTHKDVHEENIFC